MDPLEANMRVTNGIPLGCPLLSPLVIINYVETLKALDYFGHYEFHRIKGKS
jgi:hypothetical protein